MGQKDSTRVFLSLEYDFASLGNGLLTFWMRTVFLFSRFWKSYKYPLLGVQGPGRGVKHSDSPSSKVKEKIELYFYFFCGPS